MQQIQLAHKMAILLDRFPKMLAKASFLRQTQKQLVRPPAD
jgi:hypothetical protein